MKEWRSAAELASLALPGMPATDRAFQFRAARENWKSRPRVGQGGGLEYHMSSLPTAAQVKLTLMEKKSRQSSETAAPPANRTELWRWYDGLPDAKKAKARMRADVLEAVIALHRNGVTKDVAVMTVAQHHNVGPSTVYNWMTLVAGHALAVVERSGGTLNVSLNGVLVGTDAIGAGVIRTASDTLLIGAERGGGLPGYSGNLYTLRFSSGAARYPIAALPARLVRPFPTYNPAVWA